jgi:DNA-binding SARP family transcriptional activator
LLFSEVNDDKLRIYTLGRFVVCRGTESLSDDHCRSRKIWDLFMYIITNREKPLTPENITETLWPKQDYDNASSVVKNLVHRLRRRVDAADTDALNSLLINAHGCYSYYPDYKYWLDAEEFEKLCHEARDLVRIDPNQACAKYRQALELYNGEYLPESPYSDWLLPIRHYYRQLFIESVTKLLSLLKELKQYSQMLEECKKALSVEQFEESLHVRYIEALLGEGETSRARAHYEYCSSLFYQEFGTKPSPALTKLYRAILQQDGKTEIDFKDIHDVLSEADEAEGAIFCQSDVFRILCKMKRRMAEREDIPIHVGLIALYTGGYQMPPEDDLYEKMNVLKDLLAETLRKGDVCSAWNENQYAILLPGANQEQAGAVLNRVTESFDQNYPQHDLILQISAHSLAPKVYS